MLLTLLHVTLYSAVTMHALEPLDARCRPWTRGPLFVTYAAVGQSCAPGGPCSQTAMGDLPRSGIKVTVEGCSKPLVGKFVETGRRCRGLRLRKFTGRVPGGVNFSITTPRTGLGYLESPGRERGFRCPGARGPIKTLEHDLKPVTVWRNGHWEMPIPKAQLMFRPDGPDHFRVIWEGTTSWPLDAPMEVRVAGRTPEIVLAKARRDDRGRIIARAEAQVRETLRGRKGGRCQATWTWTVHFSIPQTAIEMQGQGGNDIVRKNASCQPLQDSLK